MKFAGIFSIFALLLISLPLLDAVVICPNGRVDQVDKGDEKGEVKCPTSCAAYSCKGLVNNASFEVHDYGCPSDFFRDCAFFDEAIQFVNASTTPDEMTYSNDNVKYVSGCGGDKDSHGCIVKKFANFAKENPPVSPVSPSNPITTDASRVFETSEKPLVPVPDPIVPVDSNGSTVVPIVPVVTSKDGSDILLGKTVGPNVTAGLLGPSDGPTTAVPLVTGPIIPGEQTLAPPAPGNTDAPVTRSSRLPSSASSTTTSNPLVPAEPTSKPDPPIPGPDDASTSKPDDQPTTAGSGQLIDDNGNSSSTLSPNDATTSTPTDNNASKGQEKSFWKKIGCFTIGLILAAWIY